MAQSDCDGYRFKFQLNKTRNYSMCENFNKQKSYKQITSGVHFL